MKQLVAGDLLKEEHLLVIKATVKSTKRGKPYVEFDCRNTDGMEVTKCKIWGTNLTPPDNTVIKVMGRVDEYEGSLHYVVDSWDEDPSVKSDEFEKQNPLGELSKDEVCNGWNKWVNMIQNDFFKKWLVDFVTFWSMHRFPSTEPCEARFSIHPAAQTIHHDYKHGLIQHSIQVMRTARGMGMIMDLPERTLDLVTMGGAIHDIGKLEEIEVIGGVPSFSKMAKYYGWSSNAHLYIGSQMLLWTQVKSANDEHEPLPMRLPEDVFLILMNVILSHHGDYADVKPNSIVSQIVHQADMASTRVNTIQCGLKLNLSGEMTMPEPGKGRQNFLSV